ncbi:importin-11 [Cylas formicarius]|uniref:importin-11 n=1 Tax=Cylas formicarius TaxID=197179 RepID=UPI002958C47B|nr:importin-11 [Cylas formicarius]
MDLTSTHAVVLDVLQRASSQNPEILKPAETKLREWETQPGFYSILCNVISNHSLDVNVRWIAVLYMKNGIDKYWRKNAPNGIADDEKQAIRQNLLSDFVEPINQIAVQRAVLISKVARLDCPKDWPELFPTLLHAVESSDAVIQHRALLTLHHVVKAIASKRLAGDRKQFQDFTSNIFVYILNLWNNLTQGFIEGIMQGANRDVVVINLEKALLTLRILRKLAVFGYYKPHLSQDCMNFLKMIFEKCKTVLHCRKEISGKGLYPVELCEKFVVHLTKVLLSMLDTHPFSYVNLIQPTLEFTVFYLFTDEGITFLFERFVIQCFNLIKSILLCAEYRAPKFAEMSKSPDTLKAHSIKQAFFQPQTIQDITRKLIGHYFILTQDELDMWDADPEGFSIDESGDSWKYSLRPSMDNVFMTIVHEYKEVATPVIVDLIAETNVIVSPDDLPQILRKDAIYNAAGLCACDLYDEVDFDGWFQNTLVQELKIKHNNYRIIRRRVISLIGNWTVIKMSTELRPILYECAIDLLKPDEDMAVRLTAAATLRHAIDDFEFSCDQFKDYMFSSFTSLFNLLKEASECETKMQTLNVMTLLLERMGNSVLPHSEALIQYLPHLWQESEEHNMLRCAIVATLVQLVKAMGGVPQELAPFLLPIIRLGTDTNQGAIVYLLEDSLDLWLAVLEYSPSMTNDFMQLFNNMPTLLDYSTENLRACLYICLVHLLLAPELVMRSQGTQIITVCDSLMSDLKNEGVMMIMRLIDTFIRAIPVLGAETVLPILPRILKRVYAANEYPLVMSTFLSILSRVLLSSHEVFSRALSKLAELQNESDQVTLSKVLDSWLEKMPNVAQPDQRKLLALALTNLLTTRSNTVLERFNLVMVNITEALNDITKTEDNGTTVDSLVLVEGQSPSHFEDELTYYDTDHNQRKKQLILSDPVHTIVLKDYLQSQIFELKSQMGPHYEQLMNTLDGDVILQLKDYITF